MNEAVGALGDGAVEAEARPAVAVHLPQQWVVLVLRVAKFEAVNLVVVPRVEPAMSSRMGHRVTGAGMARLVINSYFNRSELIGLPYN